MIIITIIITIIIIRHGKRIEGWAYCYKDTGDNPKGLVGHLESIGVNLDVARNSANPPTGS